MKRNRRDSSETVVRGRQDQPRRSKRIKEHEVSCVSDSRCWKMLRVRHADDAQAQVTMLRNNPCKVEHVIEELARSSKDQPIDLTED